MNFFRSFATVALLSLSISLVGCFEPDRETYRNNAAQDFCDEAERCDNLGSDGLHDTHADCIIDREKMFNDLWPADECDDGRINDDAYERCMRRALDYACDGGFFDGLSTLERCSAAEVCID